MMETANIYQEKVGFARKISLNGSSEDEFSLDVDLSKLKEKQGKTNHNPAINQMTYFIPGCCTGGCVRGAIVVASVTITLVILGGAVLFLDLRDHRKVSTMTVIDDTFILRMYFPQKNFCFCGQ